MQPTILAFDTSTDELHAGVLVQGRILARSEPGGARASTRLLPLIMELLADAGVPMRSLDAVGFGRGPGAFTGLRTACAVAQGLAWGLDRPVLPVDSLMIVAEEVAGATGQVFDGWVAMDARMDEVYAARYRRSADGTWDVPDPPALYTLQALAARWRDEPPSCVAGSAVVAFAQRLPFGHAACMAPGPDRAAALTRLALAAWHAGAAVDAAQALPLYLRDKVALTTAEREVVAAARGAR